MKASTRKKLNKKIDRMFFNHDISYCEVRLPGCSIEPITRAHRHKVFWYDTHAEEKFYAYESVIGCCLSCHMKLEQDANLTEKIFFALRGKE